MTEPKIAQKGAYAVDVVEGKNYAWCSCGLSQNQPFCDGKHSGSSFSPTLFKAEKTGKMYLCGCKHSNKGHLCDGSHSSL